MTPELARNPPFPHFGDAPHIDEGRGRGMGEKAHRSSELYGALQY